MSWISLKETISQAVRREFVEARLEGLSTHLNKVQWVKSSMVKCMEALQRLVREFVLDIDESINDDEVKDDELILKAKLCQNHD